MWSAAVDSFGKKATCQRLECQRQQQQHWWRWDGEWWKLPACPLQHSSIPCSSSSSSSSSIPCLAPALHSTLTTTTVHSISPRSVPAEGCWLLMLNWHAMTKAAHRRHYYALLTMNVVHWFTFGFNPHPHGLMMVLILNWVKVVRWFVRRCGSSKFATEKDLDKWVPL